jgi:hypothetical protein
MWQFWQLADNKNIYAVYTDSSVIGEGEIVKAFGPVYDKPNLNLNAATIQKSKEFFAKHSEQENIKLLEAQRYTGVVKKWN